MNDFATSPHPANAPLIDDAADSGERTYATFLHLSLLGHLIFPLAIIFAPLVLWLIKRKESPFIDDHGREAINFQISLLIYMLASGILVICGVGIVLIPLVYVLGLVGMVMAGIAANKGHYYRYPATLRFLD